MIGTNRERENQGNSVLATCFDDDDDDGDDDDEENISPP